MRFIPAFLIFVCLFGFFSPAQARVTDRPIPAWPLVYYFPKDDGATAGAVGGILHYKRKGTLKRYALRPFLFSTENDPERDYLKTSLVWPLNIYKQEGDERSFHSFPLIWYGRSLNARHTVLFPLYWNIENPSGSHFHLWPLMGLDRSGTQTTYSTLLPFFRYSRDLAGRDFDIHAPWPLINFKKEGDYLSHRLLPLYWRERGPQGSGGFLFPYFWRKAQDINSKGVFPLWYQSRGPDLRTNLIFPLYFSRRDGDSRIRFITPFYFTHATDDSGLRIIFPLYAGRRTPESRFHWITPLYFSGRSEASRLRALIPLYVDLRREERILRMITPLYLNTRDEASRMDLLFPVFMSFKNLEKERVFQAGLPSFLRFQDPSGGFTTLFPLYFRYRDLREDTDLKYFFPVYGTLARGDIVTRHFIFFPLYSRMKDDDLKTTSLDILWPFFHHSSSPLKTSTRILPFLWKTTEADRKLTVSFPFYWYFEKEDLSYRHFFPFYGVHKRGEGYTKRFVLGPVFIRTRDEQADRTQQDVLFPLFHHSREGEASRTWLVPFYFGSSKDKDHAFAFGSAAFLPPYYIRLAGPDKELRHLWPFYGYSRYGSRQVRSALWPLVRFSRDLEKESRLSWVFPFYFHAGESDTKLTLGSLALLPPYYVNKRKGEGDRLLHLWPLYGHVEQGSYREYSTLWPLIRYGSDPDTGLKMTQLLVFYHKRQAGTGESTTTLFPLWWRHSKDSETRDLSLFLHWYDRDNDRTRLSLGWVIPHYLSLIHYQKGDGISEHAFFPLYGYKRNLQQDSLRFSFLWPLFSYSREGEFAEQSGFLWKVVSYEKTGPDSSDFRVLWRLFRKSRTPTSKNLEFNPFFYYESEEGKGSYWAVLGGLIGRETKENGETNMRWFWFF